MISKTLQGIPQATAAALVILGGLTLGCAHDIPLQTSNRIPAAEGQIKISKADNDNTKMKLEVDHLAEPEKLVPGASSYVVWIQSGSGDIQNVGALVVDDKRRAKLETVTPHREFQLFVTAEPVPTAVAPTTERLLYANVHRK
jgi:hypothetical protein